MTSLSHTEDANELYRAQSHYLFTLNIAFKVPAVVVVVVHYPMVLQADVQKVSMDSTVLCTLLTETSVLVGLNNGVLQEIDLQANFIRHVQISFFFMRYASHIFE